MTRCYDIPNDSDLLYAARTALEALWNVPCVGEVYDQQQADTHMAATLLLKDALDAIDNAAIAKCGGD